MNDQYENDFYAWANTQAALLRSGNFVQADIEHIVEEIESMGKSELRELENRLALLFMLLLKWRFPHPGPLPEGEGDKERARRDFHATRRGRSWELTIKGQRRKLRRHLDQNSSLKARLPQAIDDAYGDAILEAARETDLPEIRFPRTCPFSFEQTLDDAFWPDEEGGSPEFRV